MARSRGSHGYIHSRAYVLASDFRSQHQHIPMGKVRQAAARRSAIKKQRLQPKAISAAVMAYEAWQCRDPMLVLERKQDQAARTKQGRAAKAKAGLEDLFTGEGMGRKLEIDAHIRAALCQWGRWANRPQFWANLNVTPFCKLVGIGGSRDMPEIALDPQSLHIHKAMMRMKCRVTMIVLIGYYVGNASWDDQEALYTRYGVSRKAFYEVLRSGSVALFNAAKLG